MAELRITATGDALTFNGKSWSDAPLTEELCQVAGCHDLVEGSSVIVDEKPRSKFRYFEDLGITILESIPDGRVRRMSIYLKTPPGTRQRISEYKSYGHEFQRSPKKKFCGELIINGKQLQAPLRFTDFPIKGALQFVRRVAIGPKISAFVAAPSGFVEYVAFEFRRAVE